MIHGREDDWLCRRAVVDQTSLSRRERIWVTVGTTGWLVMDIDSVESVGSGGVAYFSPRAPFVNLRWITRMQDYDPRVLGERE